MAKYDLSEHDLSEHSLQSLRCLFVPGSSFGRGITIVRDGPLESFFEGVVWFPAECLDLRGVECVALVVSRPVLDERDLVCVCVDGLENRFGDFAVRPFLARTEVVNLADVSVPKDEIDGAARVLGNRRFPGC